MGQRNVRVAVGQGDLDRAGSLRAMLERDGFEVVGDASSTSQLARILTDEHPDIVVLDDMIGVGAVEVATEIVPDARLVVVWPAAVMPIAGAVRVEPSEVATTLTATVALAAGLSGLGAIDRPEWIERVKKDPATLREMLAAGGSLPARPSVTELQRRGHRLHPSPAASTRAARSTDAAAAVVPIGVAAAKHEDDAAAAAGAATAATVPPTESRWNRRLGVVSLGSAAAAGAVMIALALGGGRAPSIVSAEPLHPLVVSHGGGPAFGTDGGTTNTDGSGGTTQNGGGETGPGSGGSTAPNGTIHVLNNGSGTGGSGTGGASGSGGGSTGGGTGGSGTGGAPGGAGTPGGPRSSASHLPGAHGSGRSGGAPGQAPAPGGSGDHNPHGGPPGHSPGHGGNPHGTGNGNGQANGHNSHTNAGHGNGNGGRSGSHGKSADAHNDKR